MDNNFSSELQKKIDAQKKNTEQFKDIFQEIEDIRNIKFPSKEQEQGALKALMLLQNYILNREL